MFKIQADCLLADGCLSSNEITIVDQHIVAIEPITTPLKAPIILPGFIDLQVNGAGGKLFNESPNLDALDTIGDTIRGYGTTSWLATLVTDDIDVMQRAADAVSQAVKESRSGVLGIHFEGPHISISKRGVHSQKHIRPIGEQEMALYSRQDIGIKLLTIAPEQLSTDQIKQLVDVGCILSIGHTAADYQLSCDAISSGAQCFTHLYNAMSGLSGREPGAIGAALDTNAYYGFIMDGIHVHPSMARLAYSRNPNMILVTDAMPPVGTEQTVFQWFGQEVHRKKDRLVDAEGRLAGAYITQDQALKNAMQQLDISITQAAAMVTELPAKLLDLYPNLGQIAVGSRADLVAMDGALNIQQVWVAGKAI